jgi:hypothetical protein
MTNHIVQGKITQDYATYFQNFGTSEIISNNHLSQYLIFRGKSNKNSINLGQFHEIKIIIRITIG